MKHEAELIMAVVWIELEGFTLVNKVLSVDTRKLALSSTVAECGSLFL